jgi:hypothetical protein
LPVNEVLCEHVTRVFLSKIISKASAKPIGVAIDIGKREAAAIWNPIAIPIPMMLLKPH